MRRDIKDNLIRGFLAINALLREETKALRRQIEARRETKYNPNWSAQPRAPKGGADGGQWVGGGGGSTRRLKIGETTRRPRAGDNAPPVDTLVEIFPGLPNSPANAILAPIDGFLGFSNTAAGANEEATRGFANALIREIRNIDPLYRPPRLVEPGGFPSTIEGRNNYLDQLRLDRAAAIYRVRGDYRPLQAETLRFIQRRVDAAYARGLSLLRTGHLRGSLSGREALGNYIDREVRDEMRNVYAHRQISTTDSEVRIQAREYDTSGTDLTYRIPDVRVGRVAFDASLTRKTPGRAQIRGYFGADFRPEYVIIVRPTELGGFYVITSPEFGSGD